MSSSSPTALGDDFAAPLQSVLPPVLFSVLDLASSSDSGGD